MLKAWLCIFTTLYEKKHVNLFHLCLEINKWNGKFPHLHTWFPHYRTRVSWAWTCGTLAASSPERMSLQCFVIWSLFVHSGRLSCSCGSCENNSLLHSLLTETLPSAPPTLGMQTCKLACCSLLGQPELEPIIWDEGRSSPMSHFHRCSFTPKSHTHFFLCFLVGAGAAVDLQDDGDNDDDILAYCLGLFQELLLINSLI